MTETGDTKPAGEGLNDEELVKDVAEETSPDLKAEDVFERESDGTATDKSAQDEGADEVQ